VKRIAILGSTGSIGTQTLDVIARHPDRFQVECLAAGRNVDRLLGQIRQFRPSLVAVRDREAAEKLKPHVAAETRIVYGEEGLIEAAASTDADFVVTAVVGSVGLKPTVAAIEAGKTIGIANKETLVSAGHIVSALAKKHNVKLLPIDSEHSAIHQCLKGETSDEVNRIVLTASGGAFRDRTRDQLKNVTPDEALSHPNWSMGAKITIDSATMANKGLEVIEAHWLFGLPYSKIEVVLHPESIVHSYVEFADYSIIAQLGLPDMRVPIQYALTYPERIRTPGKPLDLTELGKLHFRKMDFERFPCLRMAYECGIAGGSAPTVFNAANEVAVSRFLQGEIGFLDIERVIETVLEAHDPVANPELEQIFDIDAWAREKARRVPPASP